MILALLAAAGFQATASLDRAVAAFTGHAVGEEGGARTPVDARLRLAACPMVSLSWRTEAHDAVVVACSGPDWRLFVPVVRIAGITPAATTAIAQAAVAKAAPVIKRGDPVLVEAGTDGFSVTREGIAMGDAAPGSRFLVKVEDAKGPVQAVATVDGRAVLPGWSQ
ncbi:flagella basal body P-ring formation protein FlgA [Sphingomonas bacterium]|uniref:flagella basal body P-ring formation protein FlgA n=1 Tax=Sphingomonas bacterium TaxID=1895847 RepID=UPI0015758A61|nr:flagella basal body P-ring formation protein FlgA [Sphingomonas bacterium]